MISILSTKTYDIRLKTFKPKIKFSIKVGNFIVKTVEDSNELKKILHLRYNVFYKEMLNKKKLFKLDVDKFDFIADHIMVIDTKTNNVIGTYRVLCSLFTNKFYSETEFDISNIKLLKATKIELGRASISKEYRNGISLIALWKGIANYSKAVDARYVFGCSSIKTENILEIIFAYKYLRQYEETISKPHENFRIKNFDKYIELLDKITIDTKELKVFIPPLLQSYIKAGAKICGTPAYDKHFKCADFMTLLDTNDMNHSLTSKLL